MGRKATLAASVLALLASPSGSFAETVVHNGLSKEQLAKFAERQGWRTNLSSISDHVTIHVGDRTVFVTLANCGADGICLSGVIREQTYNFIKSDSATCTLWHWNMDTKGATGFGPSYVTLQRYLIFRGVTDQYLKDAINAYLAAAPSFWKLVQECSVEK